MNDWSIAPATTELLVLQATPFCNIDCSYCYLPDRGSRERIGEEIVVGSLRWLREAGLLGSRLDVLWHAGEPLVLPVSSYERLFQALASEAPAHVAIRHLFQTNATLINNEWCDFFQRNHVHVGVSIDAPESAHDQTRKYRSGRSTWAATTRGIQKLVQHDIDHTSISVLSSKALDSWGEIIPCLTGQGLKVLAFNIEETEGSNRASSVGIGESDKYEALVRAMWAEHYRLGGAHIREIDTAVRRIQADSVVRPIGATPFSIVSVDVKGNLSTFSPELLTSQHAKWGDFKFGNVLSDSLEKVVSLEKFQRVAAAIERGKRLCESSCEYFSVCGGGEPVNKLFENGDFASRETVHCQMTVMKVIDVILSQIETEMQRN